MIGLIDGLSGCLLVACVILEAFEIIELLLSRDSSQSLLRPPSRRPFVSFHVPIYSEPPEIVEKTLLALRDLNYADFEVLVVDNNTADEKLWRPVEQLCGELGGRFRFFHLPVWPGFKAGALNFALRETAADASIIGIIDADYQTDPNYLEDVIGHFDDPQVAFVQTPQDYRKSSGSWFFDLCRLEYWQVFAVSMVLRNRRNAILMHGTMSLVRRDALARAGGWAEWCLTEDSELGLRLLAAGYRGVYIPKTCGRGLTPFSHRDYKRQRRRWVIGGAQQLRRYWRLFVRGSGDDGRLALAQRLHYLLGWLPWFRDSIVVASLPAALVTGAGILLGALRSGALNVLALGIACVLLHHAARTLVVYRSHLAASWREAAGAAGANCSLTWAVGCGWLAGFAQREQAFQRTPKRPQRAPGWVAGARAELVLGLLAAAMGAAILARFGLSGLAAALALASYSVLLLPAVWMARLSSRRSPDADPAESGGV